MTADRAFLIALAVLEAHPELLTRWENQRTPDGGRVK